MTHRDMYTRSRLSLESKTVLSALLPVRLRAAGAGVRPASSPLWTVWTFKAKGLGGGLLYPERVIEGL